MAFASRTSPQFSITVAGNAVAVDSFSFTDGIAPEVGSATFRVLLGRRLVGGAVVTSEPVVACRDLVAISIGSVTWRGYVAQITESGQPSESGAIGGRSLMVIAYGIGADLDRAYLASFRRRSLSTGNAVASPFSEDFNQGNRPNRSATAFSIGATTAYVMESNISAASKWTQLEAIRAILAVAAADLGIPLIAVVGDTSILTLRRPWAVRGLSVWAAISRVMGQRSNNAWFIRWSGSQWELVVVAVPGAGIHLDLTGPFIRDYSVTTDGRATASALRARGGKKTYCLTLLGYPGSSGSSIIPAWDSSDVTARGNGDRGSPAFNTFRLDTSTNLPDGTSLGNARILSSVPFISESGGVFGGRGISGPPMLFAKTSASGGWISLSGLVSISVRGGLVAISGDYWEQLWKQMEAGGGRFALTIACESLDTTEDISTGGAGNVVSLMESQADRISFVTGTYTGVSGGGAVSVSSGSLADDSADLAAEAAAYWEHVRADRKTVAWSERGNAPAYGPGGLIADVKIPLDDATHRTDTLVLAVISRRVCEWTPLGVVTSYESAPLPISFSGIAG